MFILLLSLAAFLVAGSTAYFSTLGIASLFSGKYWQVLTMAGCLEFGKLVATSYLYRYWNKTPLFLKAYLLPAVLTLMIVTSMGVFGYLTSAYQVNASKNDIIENKIVLIQQQKQTLDKEIESIDGRIVTLNQSRLSQEKRLTDNKVTSSTRIYNDIKNSQEEIKNLNGRLQELQKIKFDKDNEIIQLNSEASKANDIGTFKFVAQAFDKPVNDIVKIFVLILVCVLDPLAVSLVLALNVATKGNVLKEDNKDKKDNETKTAVGFVATGKVRNS
jgi:hypothetical protein